MEAATPTLDNLGANGSRTERRPPGPALRIKLVRSAQCEHDTLASGCLEMRCRVRFVQAWVRAYMIEARLRIHECANPETTWSVKQVRRGLKDLMTNYPVMSDAVEAWIMGA